MAFYAVDNIRFPALKQRLASFRDFRFSPRSRMLELEGIFVYESSDAGFHKGFLDASEEFRLLDLQPPNEALPVIRCLIPASLVSKDRLLGKPNVRVFGQVEVDAGSVESKRLAVEEIEFLPVTYRAVGSPVFADLDDMFSQVYGRGAELHEYGAFLMLASLIGSEKKSAYFPEENVGCGVNIGASARDVPGKVGAGRISQALENQLAGFIKRVNIGSIDSISPQLKWNRFLSVKDPNILSRTLKTRGEIDWNLISDIGGINALRNSQFLTSDISLVFDPSLFPKRINRFDALDIKQTILFARSTPQIQYSADASAWIENATDKVVRDLAKEVEYAPLLFRYRFEPLCDAFIKGSHLLDYLVDGDIKVRKKDVSDFFSLAGDAAKDFADYSRDYVKERAFSPILDSVGDRRLQDLYKELLVKGQMSEEQMTHYLAERYNLAEKKADSLVANLLHAEPALVLRKGRVYRPA